MLKRDPCKERALWVSYWRKTDKDTLTALTEYFDPYVRIVTKRMYKRYGFNEVDFDDFYQNASLGLIEAIPRFKPEYNVDFLSYASFRIRGAVLNGLRFTTEKANFNSYKKSLDNERKQSLVDGSENQTLNGASSLERVIIQLAYSHLLDSLPEYLDDNTEARESTSNPYDIHAVSQLRRRIANKVSTLNDPEKSVIELHYFGQFKFDDIAEFLGVTKGRVSQIHKSAINRLRIRYQQDM